MAFKKRARREAGIPSVLLGETEGTRRYPEIYFKMQPDIQAACDEMIKLTSRRPSEELVERMTNRVYDSVCKKYPDLAKHAHEYESRALSAPITQTVFGIQVRVQGLFKGLIAFLLLAELFRRRRWR